MFNQLYRPVISTLSRTPKLSILIYHQVLPTFDPMRPEEVTAEKFNQQLGWVAKQFRIFSLSDALKKLRQGTLPSRALCITFDDGYANNATVALPILQKHGLTATLFVASDFIDGGIMWNDRVIETLRQHPRSEIDLSWLGLEQYPLEHVTQRAQVAQRVLNHIKHLTDEQRQAAVSHISSGSVVPTNIMLSTAQLCELADAGIEIGGHTCSHPILSGLGLDAQHAEITINKQKLESILDQPITGFAYPNGKPEQDFSKASVQAVKYAGYHWAVTTQPGVSLRGTDPFQLPRFTPWRQDKVGFLLQLARNYRTQSQPL